MTITVSSLITSIIPQDFKSKLLDLANAIGLTATDWYSGSVTRTTIVALAHTLAMGFGTSATQQLIDVGITKDGIVSTFAQGAFLKFASAVTPDPSIANSDGTYPPFGVGFLDSLALGIYNVSRSGGPNGGATAQSNAELLAECLAKLQPIGVMLAEEDIDPYTYYATTGYDGDALSAPITRVALVEAPANGSVDVYLANASDVAPAPDVDSVNIFYHANCVPWTITVRTHAATALNITVACDAYVPTRYSSQALADIITAITDYVNSLPIGGATGLNALPISAMEAYVFQNVSYLSDLENLQVNGSSADLSMSTTECAVLFASPTVTLHLV